MKKKIILKCTAEGCDKCPLNFKSKHAPRPADWECPLWMLANVPIGKSVELKILIKDLDEYQ